MNSSTTAISFLRQPSTTATSFWNGTESLLVYDKILGQGSYKTVYRVRVVEKGEDDETSPSYYALAVQKVRTKTDLNDGLRGIQMALQLQTSLPEHERHYMEQVKAWWFQSAAPNVFCENGTVFMDPSTLTSPIRRTQQKPSLRRQQSWWLIAIKPLYEMDLQSFCQLAPLQYTITGHAAVSDQNDAPTTVLKAPFLEQKSTMVQVLAGLELTDTGACKFALELLHAGAVLHEVAHVLHRDVKPSNIMLQRNGDGHVVLIDFGFAVTLSSSSSNKGECYEQPGVIKGDLPYVLAQDVAQYRACRAGDAYALGKTLYQVLFLPSAAIVPGDGSSEKQQPDRGITVQRAEQSNRVFRSLLFEDDSKPTASRFAMRSSTRDILLHVVRGLCRLDHPLSLAEAETWLRQQYQFTNKNEVMQPSGNVSA